MKDTSRLEEIAANWERADESLAAARTLLEEEYPDFAAARAYYAAFYAATAALLTEDYRFAKHAGVINGVHLHFVKTGRLPREVGKSLNWLAEIRIIGDYGETRRVPSGEAHRAIETAIQLIEALRSLSETSSSQES